MGFCNGSILNVDRKIHIVLPDAIVRVPATSLKFLCRIGGGGLNPIDLERLGLGLWRTRTPNGGARAVGKFGASEARL